MTAWRYTVALKYDDTIHAEDDITDEDTAKEIILDRFRDDVSDLMLRQSFEEFLAAVDITLEKVT